MDEKNKPDQYVEYLNRHILPLINYDRLHESYETDMVYAKGILNLMHEAMVSVYGGELLDETDGDEGIVVIPGIVRGKNNGNLCLALLDLDLSSSGEHWGTAFLCKSGVISQNEAFSNQAGASEMREAIKAYAPYDYCYTAVIPDDIHVDTMRLPLELVTILNEFRNHKTVLANEQEANALAPYGSDGYQMDEQDFISRMTTLLPGIESVDFSNLFIYAKEMEEDGNISASGYFKQVFVEFGLVTSQHGQETARQLLEVCKTFALNPWEIRDAADSIRAGVPLENIGEIAVDIGFDRTGERWQEYEAAMEAFEKIAADKPQPDKEIMENDQRIIPATHLPDGWEWRLYDDGSGGLYSPENKSVVEVDFATSEYRREGEWHFIAGYPYNTVSPAEFMDSMEKRICGSLERGSQQSVLDKIREAAKEPAKPRKNKSQRDKSQPEL